ncbi:uncharacterized protein BCR38DRAFT_388759 [Pseudomassariella vexata]|uniref:F-box domain-containing protein n=1 Tax=Pseudomassariella vexata TaxID=1141098 RepID=A0A1Y2E8D9_9PEZI|nr:uncharacterized protein BCR38DRAFT_388759 [Pseudomassariella vexata]ORY67831.1 hypothetical protein BCR38DRAFT_388759 [Pseudomassariella vexata]
MGQAFQLAVSRAKMALSWGGKLREMLSDGSARVLVRLLAVPVQPRNLLEASPSAPIRRQRDHCATQVAAGDLPKDVWMGRYAKRKADGEVLAGSSRRHKQAKTTGVHDRVDINHSVTFSDLPREIHRLIFTYVECIEDLICLGLANRYLWAIGRECMHDYYASFLGRWARRNIVCVGEDFRPDDYPPGLFSAKELSVLRQTTSDIPYDFDFPDEVADPNVPFTLHHFTFPSVSDMEEDVCLFNKSLGLVGRLSTLGISKDAAFASIRSEMRITEETYFPKDQLWILRNLMTKQFVRSEAIALKPELIHGPNINALGFGDVVMSRICWSTSSSVSMNDTTNISRGVWAGHCFDITTFVRHKDETNEAEWGDVSDEVASEIAGIWESAYGANWRETVCNLRYQTSGHRFAPKF